MIALLIRLGAWALAGFAGAIAALGFAGWGVWLRRAALRWDHRAYRTWLAHAEALRLLGRRPAGLACLARSEAVLRLSSAPSGGRLGRYDAERRAAAAEEIVAAWRRFARRAEAREALLAALQAAPRAAGLWDAFADLTAEENGAEAALSAQTRALDIDPQDRRMASAMARRLAAAGREAEAAARDPSRAHPDALAEEAPPAFVDRAPAAGPAQIILDVTDILDAMDRAGPWTDAERFQLGMANALLEPDADAPRAQAAVFDASRGRFDIVDARRVVACLRLVERPGRLTRAAPPALQAWLRRRRAAAAAQARRRGLEATPGAVVVSGPGAAEERMLDAWKKMRALRAAKRAFGVRVAAFVHDCAPHLAPDLHPPGFADGFRRWLAAAAENADAFLAPSEAVARDLRAAVGAVGQSQAPILTAPPAVGPVARGRGSRPWLDGPLMRRLARRGFALVVGPISGLSGHLRLLRLWRSLVQRHGEAAPVLLIVGPLRTAAEPALEFFDEIPDLAPSVAFAPEAGSQELAWLRRRCLFTISPGDLDGSALSVAESFAAGAPALAARGGAAPEIGGDAAVYVDPADKADFLAQLEALAFDAPLREAAAGRAKTAAPPAMREAAAALRRALGTVAAEPVRISALAPAIAVSRTYRFDRREFGRDLAVQEAALFGPAWVGRQPDGLWAVAGAEARVAVRLPATARAGLWRGALRLEAVAEAPATAVLEVDGRPGASQALQPAAKSQMLQFDAAIPAGGDGVLEVVFKTSDRPGARAFAVRSLRLSPAARIR